MRDLMIATARPAWTLALALGIVGSVTTNFVNVRSLPSVTAFDLARVSLAQVIGEVVMIWLTPLALAGRGRGWQETGDSRNIREALAWSYAPLAASVALWIPVLMFTNGQGQPSAAPAFETPSLGIVRFGAESICPMWFRILAVATLKEVQRTSWLGSVLQYGFSRAVAVIVYIAVILAVNWLF